MSANVRVFTVIRHAQALKTEPDNMRDLSEEGRRQAMERRVKLGNMGFDLVLVAPCLRHLETAIRIVPAGSVAPIFPLWDLFTPENEDGVILKRMFERLSYAPLSTYYEKCSIPEVQCLRQFGLTAWDAIHSMAIDNSARNILVVGSAIYIPTMMEAAWTSKKVKGGEATMKAILEWNTPECGAARITVEEDEEVDEDEVVKIEILD